MDEPDVIKPLNVKAVSARLGLSEYGTRGLVDRGDLTPVVRTPSLKFAVQDVEQLRQARQRAAIEEFVARDVDLVKLARDTRRQLRPLPLDPLQGGEVGLSRLPVKTRDFFGPAVLQALAIGDPERCSWCEARFLAGNLGVPEPVWDQVTLALLGNPCMERCMGRFSGAELAKLQARVHPGGVRPSGARTAPAKAAGSTAPAAPAVARSRPAQPVRADDDGRAWIAARLRTERERLKVAKREGDQRRAIQLRATIRSLEADAARVDGGAPKKAPARSGRLRCGHLLSADCACPRRASRGRR